MLSLLSSKAMRSDDQTANQPTGSSGAASGRIRGVDSDCEPANLSNLNSLLLNELAKTHRVRRGELTVLESHSSLANGLCLRELVHEAASEMKLAIVSFAIGPFASAINKIDKNWFESEQYFDELVEREILWKKHGRMNENGEQVLPPNIDPIVEEMTDRLDATCSFLQFKLFYGLKQALGAAAYLGDPAFDANDKKLFSALDCLVVQSGDSETLKFDFEAIECRHLVVFVPCLCGPALKSLKEQLVELIDKGTFEKVILIADAGSLDPADFEDLNETELGNTADCLEAPITHAFHLKLLKKK